MALEHLTGENFDEKIKGSHVAVVDFFAKWCGPCKAFAPIFEEASNEDENEDFLFAKIDVDSEMDLSIQYGIQSIPTICFFKDGELVNKHVGTMNKRNLNTTLASIE
jgi:thioredoxin 1